MAFHVMRQRQAACCAQYSNPRRVKGGVSISGSYHRVTPWNLRTAAVESERSQGCLPVLEERGTHDAQHCAPRIFLPF